MIDNLHTVKGVIFSKVVKTGPSKKPGEKDWQMCIIKVEAKVLINGKTITSVCEYLFDWNVSFDDYDIGHSIEADFYIINKIIKKKDGTGTWEKEEKRIVYIRFSDIDGVVSKPRPKQDTTFATPSPTAQEDPDFENLPF